MLYSLFVKKIRLIYSLIAKTKLYMFYTIYKSKKSNPLNK